MQNERSKKPSVEQPPFKTLPKSEWRVEQESPGRFILTAWVYGGYLYSVKIPLPDLPDDLASIDDLKAIRAVFVRGDNTPLVL